VRVYVGGVGSALALRTPRQGAVGEPGATPSRTAVLMLEAQKLAALTAAQTPLLGGESVSLAGSDFAGITPQRMATPAAGEHAAILRAASDCVRVCVGVPNTPHGSVGSVASTPLRDALKLNAVRVLVCCAVHSCARSCVRSMCVC
jgi:hypothetical protein